MSTPEERTKERTWRAYRHAERVRTEHVAQAEQALIQFDAIVARLRTGCVDTVEQLYAAYDVDVQRLRCSYIAAADAAVEAES